MTNFGGLGPKFRGRGHLVAKVFGVRVEKYFLGAGGVVKNVGGYGSNIIVGCNDNFWGHLVIEYFWSGVAKLFLGWGGPKIEVANVLGDGVTFLYV